MPFRLTLRSVFLGFAATFAVTAGATAATVTDRYLPLLTAFVRRYSALAATVDYRISLLFGAAALLTLAVLVEASRAVMAGPPAEIRPARSIIWSGVPARR